MLKKLFRQKVFKFLIGGGVAAVINLLLIFGLIEWLGFNTPTLRNVANAVSIELSLLASFFIYRVWVWPGGVWTIREVLWRQIPLYHLSAGAAVITRIFIVFPLLDRLGVNYAINTLVGVLLSAVINYLISDRLVFKTPVQSDQTRTQFTTKIYYPEGLAPGLENKSSHPKHPQSDNLTGIKVFSIVIPAHNEEGCIVPTIESISQILEQEKIAYEILVVNDNSRDKTEELLQQLNSENSQVRYINNYYPNGFGFAVRCGLENFQGDAVAIVMADSSDAPENIVDYYYKLQEGYDCVFGSRFIKGGKVIDYPTHKLLVNRLANLFIQILFGLKFNDTTNAFKAYRREVIEGISPLLSHHFNLTVEIPLKAIIRGYSYTIMPITWQNRATGVSKLKLKEMGSRYLFIVLYAWLEKYLSRGDYRRNQAQLVNRKHKVI
ncbi:glycosyltransferase [Anabaena sp. FACHB-1250]|uniref:glycosyltransferase n=1 Tax=Anabaena sp. FACHB-1250 TaxID=2692770 RepID=UPI001681658B|nr:glycosyltransferase [Anabaena sp. FACHB-1250]MBD2142193.1 glycosyltransferase [Anabaena sp. FACHB-1250]